MDGHYNNNVVSSFKKKMTDEGEQASERARETNNKERGETHLALFTNERSFRLLLLWDALCTWLCKLQRWATQCVCVQLTCFYLSPSVYLCPSVCWEKKKDGSGCWSLESNSLTKPASRTLWEDSLASKRSFSGLCWSIRRRTTYQQSKLYAHTHSHQRRDQEMDKHAEIAGAAWRRLSWILHVLEFTNQTKAHHYHWALPVGSFASPILTHTNTHSHREKQSRKHTRTCANCRRLLVIKFWIR